MRRNCYVFDLDGTLADLSHRLHHIQKEPKDWRAFFAEVGKDAPIPHMIELWFDLAFNPPRVIVSGRSDECRDATKRWLDYHGLTPSALYMRKAGDHRPDYVVKRELLDQMRADGWEPIMAFDDRDQVVKMWRDAGIPCAQVAEGDF